MAEQTLELEGTWEEILGQAGRLAGRRVRVTVLPDEPEQPSAEGSPSPRHLAMLRLLDEWQQTPLTDEEQAILDEFERFRAEHPFRLRHLEDRT